MKGKEGILQKDNGVCFLCALAGDRHEQFTHCHHVIYGTAGRKLSEKYGLKLYLCPDHHEFGKEAVHKNRATRTLLEKIAQVVFISSYGQETWMRVFGRNYLEPEELRLKAEDAFSAAAALKTLPEGSGGKPAVIDGVHGSGGFEATKDTIGDLPI